MIFDLNNIFTPEENIKKLAYDYQLAKKKTKFIIR